jgi:hypothetical protein
LQEYLGEDSARAEGIGSEEGDSENGKREVKG